MALPLLLSIRSSYVRLAFRIYFTITLTIIGLLANMSLGRISRQSIAKARPRPLTSMTGWLSGMPLLFTMIKFRRLPGGLWFGTSMIFCTVVTLISDYAVSGLVQSVYVGGRCPFGTGLVISATLDEDSWPVPPINGAPYLVVLNAQTTSAANGGLVGVYWKANRDPSFRADDLDLAGGWICTDEGNTTFPSGASPDAMIQDLYEEGKLYHYIDVPRAVTTVSNGTFAHTIILDSSATNTTGVTFDVKAAIEVTSYGTNPKTMQSFQCSMNGTGISWVLETIDSQDAMNTWVIGLPAVVYNGAGTAASSNPGARVEAVLNSMVMVAGGKDYLLSTPTTGGSNATQGCLQQMTSVPVEILILLGLVSVGFLLVSACLFVLCMRDRMELMDQTITQPMPGDLVSWMVQAVQEYRGRRGVAARDLKDWAFGLWPTGIAGITFIGKSRGSRRRIIDLGEEGDQLTAYRGDHEYQ
jgi:hypothetical protein